jgi:hypothetical protein
MLDAMIPPRLNAVGMIGGGGTFENTPGAVSVHTEAKDCGALLGGGGGRSHNPKGGIVLTSPDCSNVYCPVKCVPVEPEMPLRLDGNGAAAFVGSAEVCSSAPRSPCGLDMGSFAAGATEGDGRLVSDPERTPQR